MTMQLEMNLQGDAALNSQSEAVCTPAIRFKGFSEAWDKITLENIGVATSGTSIESEFSKVGKYKVISIGSYSEKSTYTDQGIRADLSKKTQNRILNKDDLAMILNDKTSSGNIIGRVLLIEDSESFVYNQRTQRIEPFSEKYKSAFLYQLFNSPFIRNKIIKSSQGNTQIYVNWSAIKNLSYILPSIEEQTAIGNYFQQLDSLITQHQHKHTKLLNLKQALLQKMFPKQGATVPEVRFQGFSGDWEVKEIHQLGEVVTGSTPSTQNPSYYSNDGIPWVTPTDISKNTTFHTAKYLSEHGQKIARVVPRDTILVTSIASIGKNTLLGTLGSFNQQINGLIPNKKDNLPYFLFTTSALWSNKMKRSAASGTMQIVNKTEFSELKSVVPKLKEQTKIGQLFQQLDHLITQQHALLTKLGNLKQAYLAKMFV